MLLAKDRILGETMIRMVPTPKLDSNFNINSDLDPNHSLEQVIHNIDTTFTDFDLSFLPKTEGDCNLDVDLGSPASSLVELSSLSPPSPSDQACLSPCLVTDLDYSGSSLTMFSSGAGSPFGDPKKSNHTINNQYPGYQMESPPRYVPSASPLSQAPSSPYSPGLRPMIRFSSTESVRTNSSSSINLKEDLSELAELQQQTAAAQQSPPSVLRRALVDGSLKLYPGGEFVVSTPEDHNGMITDSKNDFEEDEDPKLESVLSLVMDHLDMDPLEHVRKEIQSQCSLWNINADPQCWSQRDVVIWMRAKMQEFKIPNDSHMRAMEWLTAANIDGPGFVQIPEEEFKARLPEGGEKLYNTLGLWKNTASCYNTTTTNTNSMMDNNSCHQQPRRENNEVYTFEEAMGMIDELPQQQYNSTPPPPPKYEDAIRVVRPQTATTTTTFEAPSSLPSLVAKMPPLLDLLAEPQIQQPPPPYPMLSPAPPPPAPETILASPPSISQISTDDPEDQDSDLPMSPMSPTNASKSGPIRGSSSNIHLWQFVKDLLNQPQHSGAIHWVDQAQGIFKIVDSVRVAELWGKRKNRPAMNFDKLSRSLRQYYKKGIMKKTSRPQRLVYQFCTPYHL